MKLKNLAKVIGITSLALGSLSGLLYKISTSDEGCTSSEKDNWKMEICFYDDKIVHREEKDRDGDGKMDFFKETIYDKKFRLNPLECTETRHVTDFDGKLDKIQICTYDQCDPSKMIECIHDYGSMVCIDTPPDFNCSAIKL